MGRSGWLSIPGAAAFAALGWSSAIFHSDARPSYSTGAILLSEIPLPPVGSKLDVPIGATHVLALPFCDSCSLRSLPTRIVERASRNPKIVVLAPDPKSVARLLDAEATIVSGHEARKFGPWVDHGPVLVAIRADGRVASATAEPSAVRLALEALH